MQRQILVAVKRFLGPISIQTKDPMFGVLQPFSFRNCIVMSFKSDAIEKHDFFFANVVLRNELW